MVRREGRPRRAAQARKQGPDRKSLVKYVDTAHTQSPQYDRGQKATARLYGLPKDGRKARIVDQGGAEDLDLASASNTAACAAALAGMLSRTSLSSAGSAPLSSAAARAAQPASVICGCG